MKHARVMEKDPRAIEAARRWGELKSERVLFESDWNDIARLIRPQRGGFGMDNPASRKQEKPLSSAGILAHGNFAAGIYSGITNPAVRWGGLTTPDEDLNRWPPFAAWLDRQTRKVHGSFSPSLSSFYPASYQIYADLAAFGNGAGYDQIDTANRKFIDVTLNLGEVVVDIDFHGRVCEVVRRFRLTPRQAVREFGEKNLPPKVVELAEKGSVEKHVYFHHVLKNDQFVPRKLGPRGKRWLSHYTCEVGESLIRVSGYDEMPFYYPRWDVDSGMIYGTGPGMAALPSARSNELMEDATLRAAQSAADPTILAPDRDVLPMNGQFRPGGIIYGAMVNGRPQVQRDAASPNVGLTIAEKQAKVEEIKEAFFYSVMSLTGRTGISDDENRVLEEARLRNWAPHADRIMEEYAARKFERRYAMLMRAGQIDTPPEGTPGDAKLEIRYTSAAAMALRASEAQAVRRYVGDLLPLMQVKPELRHRLSADDYAEVLHEASPTLPQRLLVSREDAAKAAQAEAQQQQAAQAAQMMQQGGAGVRDLAVAAAQGQGQAAGPGQGGGG